MISSRRTTTRSMIINKSTRGGGSSKAFRKAALDFIPTKNQPLSVNKLRLHSLVVFSIVGRGSKRSNDGARGAWGDATSTHRLSRRR
uniref:Uncharacterized protein n=1 Tax=Cucumis melo TaxID=3656 RepID=A0A9I9EKZ4_CUCME